jgi:hypothetical protein
MPTGRPTYPPLDQTLLPDPKGRERILFVEKLLVSLTAGSLATTSNDVLQAFPTCPLWALWHTPRRTTDAQTPPVLWAETTD